MPWKLSEFMTKRQDSLFAQPQAALQGAAMGCIMTKRQDSLFAQPQAARQGAAQGCAA